MTQPNINDYELGDEFRFGGQGFTVCKCKMCNNNYFRKDKGSGKGANRIKSARLSKHVTCSDICSKDYEKSQKRKNNRKVYI